MARKKTPPASPAPRRSSRRRKTPFADRRSEPRRARAAAKASPKKGAPRSAAYDENRIVAIARDPAHIFIYWDVASDVRIAAAPLMIRIHCVTDALSFEFHPSVDADSWYFQVSPERVYRFELLMREPSGEWRPLACSQDVATPRQGADDALQRPPPESPLPEVRRPTRALPPQMPLFPRAAGVGPLTPPATPIPDGGIPSPSWARPRAFELEPTPRSPVEAIPAPAVAPYATASDSGVVSATGARTRHSRPPAPPPIPVPPPAERIFASDYAQGDRP